MRVLVLAAFFATALFCQAPSNSSAPKSAPSAPAPKTGGTPPPAAISTAPKTASAKVAAPHPPSPEDTRADALLAAALIDKNPDIRKDAVAALGLVGPREPYLTQLAGALGDKDMLVRLTAVASLVDLKNRETIPWLHKALEDEAPEVSFEAAKALWNMGDPRGRDALEAVLAGEVKTKSGVITSQKRDMLRLFHTPRTLMLFAFRQGVGFVPFPGVGAGVSSLTLLLTDAGVSGRAASALLLANDRSPAVVAALRDALLDKDPTVRAAAVHALALRDDPALLRDLVPMLDDPKDAVRLRAAATCLRFSWIQSKRAGAARLASPAAKSAPTPPNHVVQTAPANGRTAAK